MFERHVCKLLGSCLKCAAGPGVHSLSVYGLHATEERAWSVLGPGSDQFMSCMHPGFICAKCLAHKVLFAPCYAAVKHCHLSATGDKRQTPLGVRSSIPAAATKPATAPEEGRNTSTPPGLPTAM